MNGSDPLTEVFDALKEGWKEGKLEKARRNTPLSYWCKLFEGFNYSPREFYAIVERNLAIREIPGLLLDHLILHQSGLFSPKRLYLRLRREKVFFEICAAPFGTGFFVSSRLFDRRRDATWFDFLVAFFLVGVCGLFAWFEYGWVWGVIIDGGLIAAIWSLMRLSVSDGVVKLDQFLSDIPVLGPIYEYFFHPDTYYRQDVNNMYREAVHCAVMQSIDEMTNQKGLKPLTPEERRPILRELYRK